MWEQYDSCAEYANCASFPFSRSQVSSLKWLTVNQREYWRVAWLTDRLPRTAIPIVWLRSSLQAGRAVP